MGTSWNRTGVLILFILCSVYGVTVKTDSLQVRGNAQVDGKLKVGNTPKPVATDSVLTKLPDGTIGLWPISAISTDISFTDSSLWSDSSRASYKADTAEGALRLGGKTLSQIDTIGHGAIKQSIKDTASNKLWVHGKADSSVLADSVKKIPPVAFSDSSRAAYKADTSAGALRLGGKTKAYYDTVGAGWIRDSLANKLCLHCVADSARGAARLGGKTLSQIDTIGHGAIKQSIRDTASNKLWIHGKADSSVLADSVKKNLAISKITGLSDSLANKLPLHGVADSAKGARYLGGKTKTYYDTVGHGAIKQSIRDTASNKLWVHGKADSSVLADSVKKNLAISKITGLSDSLANKLPLHGVADSAKGARYLGGKTKTYYDTVGHGAINTAIAGKENSLGTSTVDKFLNGIKQWASITWSVITGKPTTISGYGITDAYTKTQVNDSLATKVPTSRTITAGTGLSGGGSLSANRTINVSFGSTAGTVCQGNDPRLSDARVPINNDYYVQGSSSTRTTDAGTADVNSYSQSGFYRALNDAPNLPTGVVGYGIIHTEYTSNQHAFQLASRLTANKLYYRRQNNGTWNPWVEIYHSGNLNPADFSLTTHNHGTGTTNRIVKYTDANGKIGNSIISDNGTSITVNGPMNVTESITSQTKELKIKTPAGRGYLILSDDTIPPGNQGFLLNSTSSKADGVIGSQRDLRLSAVGTLSVGVDSIAIYPYYADSTLPVYVHAGLDVKINKSMSITPGHANDSLLIYAPIGTNELHTRGAITFGLNGSTFTGMKRYTGNLDADGRKTIALGTGKGAKTVVIGAKVSSTSHNYYSLGRFLSTVITGDSLMIIPDNNGAPITFNKTCTYQVWCIETP